MPKPSQKKNFDFSILLVLGAVLLIIGTLIGNRDIWITGEALAIISLVRWNYKKHAPLQISKPLNIKKFLISLGILLIITIIVTLLFEFYII
ncbi:hypothetical protein ACFL29_00540 [Patescibacteria group bacterium]